LQVFRSIAALLRQSGLVLTVAFPVPARHSRPITIGLKDLMASVRDFLESSPVATAAATLDLGGGRDVTVWENRNDRVSYEAPRGHAFSLYLAGGTGTRRLDGAGASGWPGAVCVFPDGQPSEWEITTPHRFAHLYLPDDRLRADFARTHDCDASRLDVPEITFADMPHLAAPLAALARAASAGDVLLADTALSEIVARLRARKVPLRGGLCERVLPRRAEGVGQVTRDDQGIDVFLERPILQAMELEWVASVPEVRPEMQVGYYCDHSAIVRNFDNVGGGQHSLR